MLQTSLFVDSHPLGRGYNLWTQFPGDPVLVYLFWGVNERDMSECHFSDFNCVGRKIYDPTFNPNTMAAQLGFLVGLF